MKNLALIVIAILATISIASCDKSNDELRREYPQPETFEKRISKSYHLGSLSPTSWHFEEPGYKKFYGIDRNDIYAISIFNDSNKAMELTIEEYNSVDSLSYSYAILVEPGVLTTQVFRTDNEVQAVAISTRNCGKGYLTISSYNRL